MESSGLLDTILRRTSIRNFNRNKKIPTEILKKILLAGNIQPRTFIVAKDHYKEIDARGISEHWKKFISSDLKRNEKTHSNHYKEEFEKTANRKLKMFLREQEFLGK